MTWKRKTFVLGQAVEVRRHPDRFVRNNEGWEPATYKGTAPDGMSGWHRIEFPPTAKPRYVDRRTGIELHEQNGDAFESRTMLVPARRIREAR